MLSLLEDAWLLAIWIVTSGWGTLPLDDFGRLCLLIAAVGGLVTVWCALGAANEGKFAVMAILLAGATLALTLAPNFLLFFLFWEIAAVICWGVGRLVSRRSDPMLGAMLMQGLGGLGSLAMFTGLLWLSVESRSGDFAPATAEHMAYSGGLILAALLIKTLGVLTQSWRPAPPREGPLASGLLGAVGVLCLGILPLARLAQGVFAGAAWFVEPATLAALAAAVVFGLAALGERDMYRVVSYVALAQVCFLATNLFQLMTPGVAPEAILGRTMWTFVADCAAMFALYLALGNVERATGERAPPPGGGLGRALPITAIGAAVAALVLVGAPPSVGFGLLADLGRRLMVEGGWPLACFALAFALNVAALLGLIARLFFGQSTARFGERQWHVLAAMLLLSLAPLLLALDPAPLADLARPFIGRLAG